MLLLPLLPAEGMQVLVLNSYHRGFYWSDAEELGILERLQKAYPDIDIPVEFLDTKRHSGQAYLVRIKDFLKDKYSDRKIDLVITLDNPALDMVVRYGDELFPGVPVVFAGVNDFTQSMLNGRANVTGVVETQDVKSTLEIALVLHPGTREILIINDDTASGLSARKNAEALVPFFSGKVKMRFPEPGCTFEEIRDEIDSLPGNSIALITTYATDGKGQTLSNSGSTRLFTSAARVPVYSVHETRLGYGIIGGYLLTGSEHGRKAADLGLNILSGMDPGSIPVVSEGTARPMFDFIQLKRFNVSLSRLPADSVVINEPDSFYDKYKYMVWTTAIVILFLSGFVLILGLTIIRMRRAEEKFKQLADLHKTIIDTITLGLIFIKERTTQWVNNAIVAMFGYEYTELIGKNAIIYYGSGEMYKRVGVEGYAQLAGGGTYSIELEGKKKNGDLFWCHLSSKAINPQNLSQGSIWVIQDITERKNAELALKKSESVLQSTMESINEGILVVSSEGRITHYNSRFSRLFSIPDELLSTRDIEIIRSYARHKLLNPGNFIRHIEEIYQTSLPAEDILNLADGRVIERFSYPLTADSPVKGRVWLFRDISDRKNAENALAAEKEKLLVTLQSIGDGVIAADIRGCVLMMNKIAEKLTGWTLKEAEGKKLSTVFEIINERTREHCENPFDIVLKTGGVVELENHTLLRSKDGTERIIADSSAPIPDKAGKITGIVLVFRDITEKQKLIEAAQLTQKLESLGILAGGIAHDFNNLLTGLFGNIDLAISISREKQVVKYLTNAKKSMDRTRALTHQLLTFAKGGAPVMKVESLFPFIMETVNFALSGSNISCMYDIEPSIRLCSLDKNQIAQVIDNIVINAVQAMPKGGEIKISISNITLKKGEHHMLTEGNYIRISIEDKGTGIPKEIVPKIFDPFFTTKQKGSGLGLATSYSIIQHHNGCIDVESEAGRGSVFHIMLPAAEKTESIQDNRNEIAHIGSGTIFVMEDDDIIQVTLCGMLKHLGYSSECAGNGQDTLIAFKKANAENKPFKAMILDLTIPGGMGGKETVAEIRKIDRDIPVFVSSGYADDPVIANPEKYGFNDSMRKPFDIAELQKLLERNLR